MHTIAVSPSFVWVMIVGGETTSFQYASSCALLELSEWHYHANNRQQKVITNYYANITN